MLISLGLSVLPSQISSFAATTASESEVKAAFLVSFAKFVKWPETTAPLVVCAFADARFERTLERLAQGETVNGRQIISRRITRWADACNIVFVSEDEQDLFRILRQAPPGVLTVGEDPAFLREGGMINFVVENQRVRFDVNLKASERASVTLSSRLLTVARSVLR